ncbi:MAG: hypothetical protein ACUVT9_03035 [Candidatus Bathycorpusculaceae bacterium]
MVDKTLIRKMVLKAFKATVKGILFYVAYFVLWGFASPLAEIFSGLQQIVETFVIIYVVLMILEELASGTIYQYFLNVSKALFVTLYLILELNGGIFSLTYKSVNFFVDLRMVLAVVVLLSLIGIAKSMLQAVNYLSEKAEYGQNLGVN